ncbi:MAG: PLP-dependent aminotransferase family protein [candidate division NC10 bacterium]|nr:PLP-dependent aminotransferase family protein [candidate division NC10 bacterium]
MKVYRNTSSGRSPQTPTALLGRLVPNREGREPIYRQIAARVQAEIEAGRLAPGTRLPSTRELAGALGVNLITAVSAYRELIRLGLASGQVGRGTFVMVPETRAGRGVSPADPRGPGGGQATEDAAPRAEPVALPPAASRDYPTAGPGAPPHAIAAPPTPEVQELAPGWEPPPLPQSRVGMFPKPLGKGIIALSSGLPSADFFPMAAFRRALEAVLRRDVNAALQYHALEGHGPLREAAAAYFVHRGTQVRAENLLVCSGAVTGVHIAARFLTRPGDVVLTENPTYCGSLSALENLGLRVAGVPVDQEGMRVDIAERLVQQYRPKAIYTIPTYNNPTGVCLSLERRRALLALSQREAIPIIEEDYANEIGFGGQPGGTLKAMDVTGQVIYVKGFSKLLFPALRLAVMAAPAPMIRGLLIVKEGIDPYSSGLSQRLLHELMREPAFPRYVESLAGKYRLRYEALCRALGEVAGRELTWLRPEGGLHVWVRLPGGLNSQDLLAEAIEAGVSFGPGYLFVPDRKGGEFLRLSFGNASPEQIRAGVARLVKVVRRDLGRQRRRAAAPVSASMAL